jgi:enamidase
MVRLLFYLTRRFARLAQGIASVVFSAGVVVPLVLAHVGNPVWPEWQAQTAIFNVRIVDTAAGAVIDGQTVYIKDGRIAEIGPATLHPDWPRIDARNQYLLPGLIDVHAHLQSPVEVPAGFQFGYFVASMLRNLSPQRQVYLDGGITSIRDLGGSAAQGFALRASVEQHKVLGPRLFFVGRLVTSPHGHPVSTIWQDSMTKQGAILARDEETLLAGLNDNLRSDPDAVKFVHGTIGRAREELSADLLKKGIEWASQHHLISVVHAETAQEFEDAIGAGATGVEHAAYLQQVPDSLARLVAQHRPFVDPTFGEYAMDLTMRKLSPEENLHRMDCSYESALELRNAGARIVIGTDAPMVRYGSGFHDELAHFARAGFRPAEIVQFATINNAAYLGRASELGRIAVGFRADLILTKDNPLEKLDTMRQPVWTMLDGQIVSKSKE